MPGSQSLGVLCAAVTEGPYEQKSSSADTVQDVHTWRTGRTCLWSEGTTYLKLALHLHPGGKSQMETFWYQRRSLAAQLLAWGLSPCCSPCPRGQHCSKALGWELYPAGLREACTVPARQLPLTLAEGCCSSAGLGLGLLPAGSSASVTAAIEGWHQAAHPCGDRHPLGPLNTSPMGIIGYYERLLGSQ